MKLTYYPLKGPINAWARVISIVTAIYLLLYGEGVTPLIRTAFITTLALVAFYGLDLSTVRLKWKN